MMDAVWYKEKGLRKYLVISFVPIVTIVSEVLQFLGMVKGTFDIADLLCYTIPVVIYVILKGLQYFRTTNYYINVIKHII